MSTQSSAVAALGFLVFGLNTDREVGASMGCFCHPVCMSMLLFSVGADPVQYAFGICPDKHFMWCLFDHWLRLSVENSQKTAIALF